MFKLCILFNGNSMAYPCVAYVMEGMLEALTAAWLDTLLEEP